MGVVFHSMADIMAMMKSGGMIRICVLLGVLLGASARAASSGASAPYDSIVERNVFNLHAPPPAVDPKTLVPPTPPPKLTLTGITTILGKKVTFITMPAMKPGAPPESLALAEGQAQNEVEVKAIDEKAGVVKVVNHGDEQTLDFLHDGAKTSGPPPAPIGAPTSFPPPAAPPPGVMSLPPPSNPGNVIRPIRTLPNRNGSPFGGPNAGGFGGGLSSVNGQNASPLTAEEQTLLIEAQRIKAMDEGDPIQHILPPTDMTPEVTGKPNTPGTPSTF